MIYEPNGFCSVCEKYHDVKPFLNNGKSICIECGMKPEYYEEVKQNAMKHMGFDPNNKDASETYDRGMQQIADDKDARFG